MIADWQLDGLCRQVDPDLFFPEPGGSGVETAKRVCRSCPVIAECLAWALDHEEQHGVWGGLTMRERRAVSAGRRPMPEFPAVAA